jgi:hypothetical protein
MLRIGCDEDHSLLELGTGYHESHAVFSPDYNEGWKIEIPRKSARISHALRADSIHGLASIGSGNDVPLFGWQQFGGRIPSGDLLLRQVPPSWNANRRRANQGREDSDGAATISRTFRHGHLGGGQGTNRVD